MLAWPVKMIPAIAATAPATAKTASLVRRTRTPTSAAARSLPPTAYMWRPNDVPNARTVAPMVSRIAISAPLGTLGIIDSFTRLWRRFEL